MCVCVCVCRQIINMETGKLPHLETYDISRRIYVLIASQENRFMITGLGKKKCERVCYPHFHETDISVV